jgi:NAD+ synthase (glutamine-hydrolysing)
MSHYNVNTSVPKTLIRYLIEWVAGQPGTRRETAQVLERILATEISPELVPPGEDGALQSTEATIGPYELHDFALYHTTRCGVGPAKLAFLMTCAFSRGLPVSPEGGDRDVEELLRWLRVFLGRFFATSQFKRSASPNGPKVGSGGSLSPRGDWRAPSDSSAAAWLAELDRAEAWLERSRSAVGPGNS